MLPFRPPQQKKALNLTISCVLAMTALFLWIRAYNHALDLYRTPSALNDGGAPLKKIRVGGHVVPGSINHTQDSALSFQIADSTAQLHVIYNGAVPSLFQEGTEVIAVGDFDGHSLIASDLYVKHDQNYRRKKEVACS
jgi:cytochrome c-type biogenesis protein CcmE